MPSTTVISALEKNYRELMRKESNDPAVDLDVLGMFAKHWEPGRVKTRLASDVGNQSAADIYLLMLQHLLSKLSGCAAKTLLFYSPAQSQREFAELLSSTLSQLPSNPDQPWNLEPQSNGDLGNRMAEYFRNCFDQQASKVLLIGTDSPWIEPETIAAAISALDDADVVLGPTYDGGYYLIGMSRFIPELFNNVPWSTSQVFERTVEILSMNDIGFATLPTNGDIDTLKDLQDFVDLTLTNEQADPATLKLVNSMQQILNRAKDPEET